MARIPHECRRPRSITRYSDAIEVPSEQIAAGSVFVAESDGSIAGFAALLPRSDGDAELDALFVEPTIRRRGIAQSLVDHCCEVARSEGAAFLHVVGNPHAQDFYLACGFHSTGMADTRFGPGLLMQNPV